jgi:hypothetical protein
MVGHYLTSVQNTKNTSAALGCLSWLFVAFIWHQMLFSSSFYRFTMTKYFIASTEAKFISTRWLLRYAPRFHGENPKTYFPNFILNKI